MRVWFNNWTIYLDFSAIFSEIAPSKLITKGRLLPPRGAILAKPPTLRHCNKPWVRGPMSVMGAPPLVCGGGGECSQILSVL